MTNAGGVASGQTRVAVIDDQPLFRAGVVHVLTNSKQVMVVDQGATADDPVRIVQRSDVDILLIDLTPWDGLIGTVEAVSALAPATRIIVLTSQEDEDQVARALRCGARGYVLKSVSAAGLAQAIGMVQSGDVYLAPSLGARLLSRGTAPVKRATGDRVSLTPREDQILAQVSNGSTNKEIARELDISEKTVKYYMTNIMQKLNVRNRVEAVVVARARTQKSA